MLEIISPLDGFSPLGPQCGFNPAVLFANGEPGGWFEANDSTTLFTDVAGATPASSPGDAIALQLDKSQGLTLGPELVTNGGFDSDTDWTDLSTGTGSAIISGGNLSVTTVDASNRGARSQSFTTTPGMNYKFTWELVSGSGGQIRVGTASQSSNIALLLPTAEGAFFTATTTTTHIYFGTGVGATTVVYDNISVKELPGNHRTQATVAARPLYALHPVGGVRNELVSTDTLATQDVTVTAAERTLSFKGTGTVTLSGASTAGPLVGTGAEDIVSLTFTPTAGTLTLTVTGTVEEAQLELGASRTNYQTVGSTFLDVSETGKTRRGRLWYNGTSHFMQTGTITPGTDKVQVFAGVRKLSDAARGVLIEYSTSTAANNGSLVVTAPDAASATFAFESKGTALVSAVHTGIAAPATRVLTGLGDISGDSAILRVDGVQEAISTADQGTGNYLAYPLYFGARAGTSLFFSGYEDTSIIRFGPNLGADTISKVEKYVASKTPEETI